MNKKKIFNNATFKSETSSSIFFTPSALEKEETLNSKETHIFRAYSKDYSSPITSINDNEANELFNIMEEINVDEDLSLDDFAVDEALESFMDIEEFEKENKKLESNKKMKSWHDSFMNELYTTKDYKKEIEKQIEDQKNHLAKLKKDYLTSTMKKDSNVIYGRIFENNTELAKKDLQHFNGSFLHFFKSIGQSVASAFGVKILTPWEKDYIKMVELSILSKNYKAILDIDFGLHTFLPKSIKKQCVQLIENFVHSDTSLIEDYFVNSFYKNQKISQEFLIPFLFSKTGRTARLLGLKNDNSTLGKAYHQENQKQFKVVSHSFSGENYHQFYAYLERQLENPSLKKNALQYLKSSINSVYKMKAKNIFNALNYKNDKEAIQYIKNVEELGNSLSFLYTIYLSDAAQHQHLVDDVKRVAHIRQSLDHFKGVIRKFPMPPLTIKQENQLIQSLREKFGAVSDTFSTLHSSIYRNEHLQVNKKETLNDTFSLDKNLPSKANHIINAINAHYDYIQNNIKHVNRLDIPNIENIRNNRLPELLTSYLDIQPDKRDNKQNIDGKTPTDLLLISLDNFYQIFNHIVENVEEEKINALSATTRYTDKIKTNYIGNDNSSSIIDKEDIETSNTQEMEIGTTKPRKRQILYKK